MPSFQEKIRGCVHRGSGWRPRICSIPLCHRPWLAWQGFCSPPRPPHLCLPRLPGQIQAQAHLLRPRILLRSLPARVRFHRLHLRSIQVPFSDVFIDRETQFQSIHNLSLSVAPGCEDGATNSTGLEERDPQVIAYNITT